MAISITPGRPGYKSSEQFIQQQRQSNAERRIRADIRKRQQASIRRTQSINTARLTDRAFESSRSMAARQRLQAEAVRILGPASETNTAKASASQSRKFRNEQRNIGRDITATKRQMAKEDKGSIAYINLKRRLGSLESLRNLMKTRAKTESGTVNNPLSTRIEALVTYVNDYKGSSREKMRQYSRESNPLRRFLSSDEMIKRTTRANALGDVPEATTPTLEDLERELNEAAARYDSEEIKRVVRRMQNVTQEQMYNSTPTQRSLDDLSQE